MINSFSSLPLQIWHAKEARSARVGRMMMKQTFETFGAAFLLVIWAARISLMANAESDNLNEVENENVPIQGKLCLTRGCIKWSAKVLEKMDLSVNPCDNFYEFACGNFVKETMISDDKTSVSVFAHIGDKLEAQLRASLEEPIRSDELDLFKKLKTFYNDCRDTEKIEKVGLEPVKTMVEENGGWPILEGDNWNEMRFDWAKLTPKLDKLGVNSFVSISVSTDLRNSSKRSIYVGAPELGLNKELLEQDSIVEAFLNFIAKVAAAFGADPEKSKGEIRECFDLELALSNHTLSEEERRDFNRLYNPYTIGELQSEFPAIPWLDYINELLPDDVQVGIDETVVVTEPKYLKYLEGKLQRTPKRTLANYIFVKLVSNAADTLNKEMQEILLGLKQTMIGTKELPPRWKFCLDYLKIGLPELVSALYVRRYFSSNSKSEILHIVKYIKEVFEKILEESDWMDDDTKNLARKKFKATQLHLGYPDELLDDEVLTKTYGDLQVIPGDFFNTVLGVSHFVLDFNNKRLREPINKTEWIGHAKVAVVNAYFNQVENSLQFPAGIMQDQFFDLERPRYMNFGAFGSIIGHEVTHGFEDVGRQFDYDGNLNEWWKDETKAAFLEKIRCIVDQYGNYNIPEANATINGELTIGENIADNGGANEAYLAYQSWQKENDPEPLLPGLNYTQNQIFWISLAQNWCEKTTAESLQMLILSNEHSPSEYRVVGPLSNSESFSRDFRCPPGSPMNPARKCKVW